MAEQVTGGYCKTCQANRNIYRRSPNHLLHLILSILTAGLWIIIWIGVTIQFGGWRCKECGSKKVSRGTRREAQTRHTEEQIEPTLLKVDAERECPHCAEVILRKAKVCKHCGLQVEPKL